MSEYKHYDKIKDIISNEIEALKNIIQNTARKD